MTAYERFEDLLKKAGKRPADITRETGVSSTVLTEWKKGKSTPKADKLVLIADALDVSVDYLIRGGKFKKALIGPASGNMPEDIDADSATIESVITGKAYYFDDATAAVAQEIFEDSDLHALFDAARDSAPENLKLAADLLKRLKTTNPDG